MEQTIVKKVAFRSSPKNYRTTTKRWREQNDTQTRANIEAFINHLLVIPDNDDVEEGKELTNRVRIERMRACIKADKLHLAHETDLEAEVEGLKGRDKKIAAMSKELEQLKRENESLRGGTKVNKV